MGLGYGDALWNLALGTKNEVIEESGHGNGNGSGSDRLSESWDVEAGNATPESDDEELNGETVREGMEKWRGKMMLRTGMWGVAWTLCTVGIWGDGA